MPRTPSYPFRPKSTASLEPGQFWAVPIRGGYFGCGRVLQLRCSQLGKTRTAFFGGLQDWIGDAPPTSESIAGTGIARYGAMHLKAITEVGGEVLGVRPLDLDGFVLPELNSAYSLGANVLIGADIVRVAREDEWGTRPVLQYWSYGYIEQLAEALAGVRSPKR
ncbi:MAG TPA: hypothetical protein VFZ21_28100 [Gemmatimonadaceae bacterium]|nr:hypothetical protein [Gemmatimonadaceae bacterium]